MHPLKGYCLLLLIYIVSFLVAKTWFWQACCHQSPLPLGMTHAYAFLNKILGIKTYSFKVC